MEYWRENENGQLQLAFCAGLQQTPFLALLRDLCTSEGRSLSKSRFGAVGVSAEQAATHWAAVQ